MPSANRHVCLGLLLILLVCHVSVAAHAATHLPGELGQCELCSSYGASIAAVASDDDKGIPLLAGSDLLQGADTQAHSATVFFINPRGPPVDS